jgi:hypothetical protein
MARACVLAAGFALIASLMAPLAAASGGWPFGLDSTWDSFGAKRCVADGSDGYGSCGIVCGTGQVVYLSAFAYLRKWNPLTGRYSYDDTWSYASVACDTATASCSGDCSASSDRPTSHPARGTCSISAGTRAGWELIAEAECQVPGETGPMHAACGGSANLLWESDPTTVGEVYDLCAGLLYPMEITDPLCQRSCT